LVGPRSNRGNKIQNGQHINKGKMQRITISSGACGKPVSTKWGVSKLEVDNAVCILPSVCILPPVCSLQSAFYTDQIPNVHVRHFVIYVLCSLPTVHCTLIGLKR